MINTLFEVFKFVMRLELGRIYLDSKLKLVMSSIILIGNVLIKTIVGYFFLTYFFLASLNFSNFFTSSLFIFLVDFFNFCLSTLLFLLPFFSSLLVFQPRYFYFSDLYSYSFDFLNF